MQDFENMKVEHVFQKLSYEVCDECRIDPLECGSRYGNRRRCNILMNALDKIFEDSAKMHGE
jgi:hypothetical protein